MPLIQRIPPLVQGMSQQAPELRNPSAGDLQVNGVSDPVRGVGKRPGTEHVALLAGMSVDPDDLVHWIIRDENERYLFTFNGLVPRVFDLNGVPYPVLTDDPTAIGYLTSSTPGVDIDALTVSDRTYLTNTQKLTSMSPDIEPVLVEEAVVWVRAGAYDTAYTVEIDAVVNRYCTWRSTQTDGTYTNSIVETTVTTDWIATKLTNGSVAGENSNSDESPGKAGSGISAIAGFDVTRYGNFIHIKKTDGSSFEISVDDGAGNTLMSLVHTSVQGFGDLPPQANHGMKTRVKGLNESDNDDYWLEFAATAGSGFGEGTWQECAAPGSQGTINSSNMPRYLDRLQDDAAGTITGTPYGIYFKLGKPDWKTRPSGDDDTNPAPSFIGSKIDSLFLMGGRLTFASGPNICSSRVNDFDQLFKTSVINLTDDDRIDATINTANAINVKHAVAQTQEILLIGEVAQVSIPTDEVITPANFRFSPATATRVDTLAKPVVSDRSMFLPFKSTQYSGIREHSTTGIQGLKDSLTITHETPTLIKGRVKRMAVANEIQTLFIQANERPSRVYVHRSHDSGQSRVMSSMSYWDFDDSVLTMEVLDGYLYVVIARTDGATLERLSLDPIATQENQSIPFRLDRYAVLATPPSEPSAGGGSGGGGGDDDDDTGSGGGGFGGTGLDFGDATDMGGQFVTQSLGSVTRPSTEMIELSIPYAATSTMVVINSETGVEIDFTPVAGDPTRVTIDGSHAGSYLIIGEPYQLLFDFGEAVPRSSSPTGYAADTGGVLRLHRYLIDYYNSGPFEVLVRYQDGTESDPVTGAQIHDIGRSLTVADYQNGQIDVPVYGQANDSRVRIRSDSYWPCWIVQAQWVGDYFKRARSI